MARGYVDTENLFVTGGSGGGVLTAWIDRPHRPLPRGRLLLPGHQLDELGLTADIPVLGVKYWFPGHPWDHVEHYAKRSLLSVVKNVKTPTMVITGEEDYRTPMSESEQYYTGAQAAGRRDGAGARARRSPRHWRAAQPCGGQGARDRGLVRALPSASIVTATAGGRVTR